MARAAGPCRRAIIKDGKIVGWEVVKKSPRANKIRKGTFVIWDDLCQTTRAKGTLSDVAYYLYHHAGEGYCRPMYWTRKRPVDLNPAEKRAIKKYLEED